jgi:hypothetical protein
VNYSQEGQELLAKGLISPLSLLARAQGGHIKFVRNTTAKGSERTVRELAYNIDGI